MPTRHDEYGCSRHDGLLACLGYTPGEAGSAALEGEQMHAVAEEIIILEWKTYNWPNLFDTGNAFTEEHRHIVRTYTDHVRRLWNHYHEKYGDSLRMEIEKEVSIPELDIEISTIDCIFYVPFEFIHILDLKTGRTPVSPASAQLKGYMLGALSEIPAEKQAVSICQPALQDELLTVQYSGDELSRHSEMMKLVLTAAKRENAPCTPCKYCGWCARNGTCPATKAQMAMISINADKQELSNESLAQLTAYAMSIELIIGTLKQRAHAILEAGGTLPLPDGRELMLVEGRPTRVWRNEKEAEAFLVSLAIEKKDATEDSVEEIVFETKRTMLSPAKAEGVFGKAKEIREKMAPLIFEKPGNKKLAIVKPTTGETVNE